MEQTVSDQNIWIVAIHSMYLAGLTVEAMLVSRLLSPPLSGKYAEAGVDESQRSATCVLSASISKPHRAKEESSKKLHPTTAYAVLRATTRLFITRRRFSQHDIPGSARARLSD